MSLINVALAQTENPSGIIAAINRIIPGGIDNIFGLGLGVGAILAIGTIIYAGIMYAVSGDNSSKQKEARAWIIAAVKGLALIAGGFVILTIVNPQVVKVEEILMEDLAVPEVNIQPITEYIAPGDFPAGNDWQGDYDDNTSYAVGDAVRYYGASFVAYKPAEGVLPTHNSHWKVLISTPIIMEDGSPLLPGGPDGDPFGIASSLLGGDVFFLSVPLLKQGGSPWGSRSYGSCGTYTSGGCGPASVAMAVLYLTGNLYMNRGNAVETVGNAMASGGYRPCNNGVGNGTSEKGIKNVPKKYGLSSSETSGAKGITSCLKKNGVIVALMKKVTATEKEALRKTDQALTPIFTEGGHYIVVSGIDTRKNRVYIKDPGGRNVMSSELQHFFKYNRRMWCISK